MDPTLFLPSASIDDAAAFFIKKVVEVNPKIQPALVEKAFRFSWEAHQNQTRKSGDPFLAHPVAVALILAEQRLDDITIAAGLLHDVLEDTPITREMIAENSAKRSLCLWTALPRSKRFR
jgi:GTP pyrophosphokinase